MSHPIIRATALILSLSTSAAFAVDATGFYSEARDDQPTLTFLDQLEAAAYVAEYQRKSTLSTNRDPILFSRACESGRQVLIGAVGDVLLHKALAVQGMEKGFDTLWSDLSRAMALPHFMYANLEGPTAGAIAASGREVPDPGLRFDDLAYTSYPQFNYHSNLIGDLQFTGVDVVSTANNHSLDRRSIGVDRTIKALNSYGMPFMGTQTSSVTAATPTKNLDWSTTTENAGFRVAWVACTFSTNGIPDSKHQVLHCYEQRTVVLDEIRRLRADPTIDAVIVTPHWGVEYVHVPSASEVLLAKDMIEAGALIVFGGHPHVLQPVEKITASDGREGYVIYSLGNFVSGQKGVAKRTAALVYVGLTKNARGEVFVNGTRHLPIAMMYTPEGLMAKPAKGNFEEARTLANDVLSGSREIAPDEPVVTNPECQ